jgi:hypothetical protein
METFMYAFIESTDIHSEFNTDLTVDLASRFKQNI